MGGGRRERHRGWGSGWKSTDDGQHDELRADRTPCTVGRVSLALALALARLSIPCQSGVFALQAVSCASNRHTRGASHVGRSVPSGCTGTHRTPAWIARSRCYTGACCQRIGRRRGYIRDGKTGRGARARSHGRALASSRFAPAQRLPLVRASARVYLWGRKARQATGSRWLPSPPFTIALALHSMSGPATASARDGGLAGPTRPGWQGISHAIPSCLLPPPWPCPCWAHDALRSWLGTTASQTGGVGVSTASRAQWPRPIFVSSLCRAGRRRMAGGLGAARPARPLQSTRQWLRGLHVLRVLRVTGPWRCFPQRRCTDTCSSSRPPSSPLEHLQG